ncbi:hypothetical protein JJB09_04335 [Rhizobium sp. KVB221]|uniref:Uncharacterized protein n=1 Tax=Rhizobium setariae TaxID=2801340 RepID=A0A936YJ42_9HYPH|nr:hypothetical protein [Rhizobium setariae]
MSRENLNIKAIAITFVMFSTFLLAVLAWPRGEFVLVVGTPHADEAQMMDIIGRAGGTFVASGNLEWLAVAHSDRVGFAARLFSSGAMLVLDQSFASGCLERK